MQVCEQNACVAQCTASFPNGMKAPQRRTPRRWRVKQKLLDEGESN
jgi:hypothetical protein